MSEMVSGAKGKDTGLVAREQSEMQASVLLAMRFPRDERDAYAMLAAACNRPTFADKARYMFPRGGQKIVGPSVKFAREAARCWKNIRYGYRVIDATDQRTTVEGFAFDTETNTRVSCEITFRNMVQRKGQNGTEWVRADERDYAELVARHGAKMERNCILKVMPPDVIEDALEEVRRTVVRASQTDSGGKPLDRASAARRIAAAFAEYGVTAEMVERHLGHPLETITPDEIADLRATLTSIEDGNSRADEVFRMDMPSANQRAAAAAVTPLEKLTQRIVGSETEQPPMKVGGVVDGAEKPTPAVTAPELTREEADRLAMDFDAKTTGEAEAAKKGGKR